MSKPKIGFYWCASCGGCEEAVVDLAEAVLDVVALVDIVFWPCAMDFKRSDLEALADGEMAACFVNGAVRSSEQLEMAELCRRKAGLLVAFGSCAHLGGIPGLANLYSREQLLHDNFGHGVFGTVNPEATLPQPETERPEGLLELPTLDEQVKTLGQVVPVDYLLPGCPPPVALITQAVMAIVQGDLPPRGSVLAPNIALCHDCPRIDSKPEQPFVQRWRRPHQMLIDPQQCFLAQDLLCLGPATRSGCGHACIEGNMPCTGCLGPVSGVRDQGGSALSALASLVASDDAAEISAVMAGVADPVGTFYRYALPASLLPGRVGCGGNGGTKQ